MKSNIINLSEVTGNAGFDSSETLLRKCLEDDVIETHKHALLIFLNNEDGAYDISFRNAGMRRSEMIALLEILKAQLVVDLLNEV